MWKSKLSKMFLTGGRERLDVGEEVFPDVVLVAHQLLHVQARRVVEVLPRLPQQERLGIDLCLLSSGQLGQHCGLGLLEHAVEPSQHGERQDHLAVLGLLVVAPEQVGHRPDEGGQVGIAHGSYVLQNPAGLILRMNRILAWQGPSSKRDPLAAHSPCESAGRSCPDRSAAILAANPLISRRMNRTQNSGIVISVMLPVRDRLKRLDQLSV